MLYNETTCGRGAYTRGSHQKVSVRHTKVKGRRSGSGTRRLRVGVGQKVRGRGRHLKIRGRRSGSKVKSSQEKVIRRNKKVRTSHQQVRGMQ